MKLAEIIKTVTVNEIIGDAVYKKQLRTEHALSYANNSPKKSDRT